MCSNESEVLLFQTSSKSPSSTVESWSRDQLDTDLYMETSILHEITSLDGAYGNSEGSSTNLNQLQSNPARLFRPRLRPSSSSPVGRITIMSTLRSYTDGLLPGRSLPPFIHRQAFEATEMNGELDLPTPLAICRSIAQMFEDNTSDNCDFLWSAVLTAQNYLAKKVYSYSDRQIIAALQAITVYFILRISNHDQKHVKLDHALVETMMVGRQVDIFVAYFNLFHYTKRDQLKTC